MDSRLVKLHVATIYLSLRAVRIAAIDVLLAQHLGCSADYLLGGHHFRPFLGFGLAFVPALVIIFDGLRVILLPVEMELAMSIHSKEAAAIRAVRLVFRRTLITDNVGVRLAIAPKRMTLVVGLEHPIWTAFCDVCGDGIAILIAAFAFNLGNQNALRFRTRCARSAPNTRSM